MHDMDLWTEKTLPYNTMAPNNYTLGMSISSSQGGGNPLRKTYSEKNAQEDED